MGNTSTHNKVVTVGNKENVADKPSQKNDENQETDAPTSVATNEKAAEKPSPNQNQDLITAATDDDEVLTRPEPLTDRQKELLRETWKILENNIAKVGIITFISLFETHPDVQQVFMPFNGMELEDLKHSKQLRSHALRVMAFVQKAVARLHEPEKLETLLQELGKKHFFYGAKQKFVDLIGPQFILAIRPSLESQWSAELHDAWMQLFLYMAFTMKLSMSEEERRNKPPPQ